MIGTISNRLLDVDTIALTESEDGIVPGYPVSSLYSNLGKLDPITVFDSLTGHYISIAMADGCEGKVVTTVVFVCTFALEVAVEY